MSTQSQPTKQIFEWPSWAVIYAYIGAIPMAVVALGLGGLFAYDYSYVFSSGELGALLLLIAFLLSFFLGAILFAVGAQRILTNQGEALNFAASGHLMLLLPVSTILMTQFLRYKFEVINDMSAVISDNRVPVELGFVIWLVFHAYLALILAFADNTTRFIGYD